MDTESEFTEKLLKTNRQLFQAGADSHTPSICIYTLGRFSLVVDGKPVQSKTKAQKKPLELLKALIASGGREVNEVLLCDALWPDKEGDATHGACATTLHRLRKLLGYDAAVLYNDSRLTLNPDVCWVDAWQFERLVGKAEANNAELADDKRVAASEHAASLYHGLFLEAEQSQPWTLSLREKLRRKYLRTLQTLGQYYCLSGKCKKAITVYERGLETDALAELFYYQLMLCYAGRGDVGRSLETYQQCRHMLNSILGIEPSDNLKGLYRDLRHSDTVKVDKNCPERRNLS